MSAIKQVHADTAELRRTQSAFQLMMMGRLEKMAAAQQAASGGLEVLLRRTGSGTSGGGSRGGSETGGSGPAGGASGAASGAASGGLAPSASLAQFLGPDEDYDMASSEGGEGSEAEEAPAGQQPDEGELRGMTEVQAAHWLMARLCEQAGAQKLYLVGVGSESSLHLSQISVMSCGRGAHSGARHCRCLPWQLRSEHCSLPIAHSAALPVFLSDAPACCL